MNKLLPVLIIMQAWAAAQEIPQNFSLYSDKKGKRSEDIITILIVEDAKAKNDTRTETDINQDMNFKMSGAGSLRFVPGMGFGMDQATDYDGRGRTSRSGTIKAKVTARIVAVFDNGNMLIEGNKEVEINNEVEIIRVSGIIRPEDINFDNTVFSYNIADAKIQYTGKGDTQNAQRPGIITRFFNWIF